MAIPRDVKTHSRKLVIREMVRMLPKLPMNSMSKMEYQGITDRTWREGHAGESKEAVAF